MAADHLGNVAGHGGLQEIRDLPVMATADEEQQEEHIPKLFGDLGLVKEIASILGLILGFVLANTYHAQLSPLLEDLLGGTGMANLVAYLGIFLGGMGGGVADFSKFLKK